MKTGIVKNFDFLAKYQDDPDVLYARPLVQPNSKVVCVEDGLPTWVCEMMVKKKSVDEAIDYVKKMEEEIQKVIPIDPLPAKKK
jgi:carnosine synthase